MTSRCCQSVPLHRPVTTVARADLHGAPFDKGSKLRSEKKNFFPAAIPAASLSTCGPWSEPRDRTWQEEVAFPRAHMDSGAAASAAQVGPASSERIDTPSGARRKKKKKGSGQIFSRWTAEISNRRAKDWIQNVETESIRIQSRSLPVNSCDSSWTRRLKVHRQGIAFQNHNLSVGSETIDRASRHLQDRESRCSGVSRFGPILQRVTLAPLRRGTAWHGMALIIVSAPHLFDDGPLF